MLALAARALPHSTAINLLQGSLRSKSATTNQWKKWRLVGMLAGALLLLHLLADVWQLRQLRKAKNHWMIPSRRFMQWRFPASLPVQMRGGAWSSDSPAPWAMPTSPAN